MVIIKRIHIKNFRSLVDETIDLNDTNYFVGKNDSGKSNVLKALNLFFNERTEFDAELDFKSDYSLLAKRGSKQAKEISISLDILLPSTYQEKGTKTWTKTWREDGLHDNNLNKIFRPNSKGITFCNRIHYMYIPAVKSNEYFKSLLSDVYASMTASTNSALKEINSAYSAQLQILTGALSAQLKNVLGFTSAIQMPQDLNVLFRNLTFSTSDTHVKAVDLDHRGDGIKARHIPSILRYMQKNAEENKVRNAISSSFIWGFEEPENGVEYLSCFEMADELYSYITGCQMLITTHSPAFYIKSDCPDSTCFYVYKNENGASKYETKLTPEAISERIGFLPLVSPYIQAERDKYILRQEAIQKQYEEIAQKYKEVTGKVIIINEGKTDFKHIKIAFENLGLDNTILSRLEYYDFSNDAVLGEQLRDLLSKLSNLPNANPIIGIFDRDKNIDPNLPGKNYSYIKNNVFRFNLPSLSNRERSAEDKICIEHYYTNDEIRVNTDFGHLYLGSDFDEYGVSSDKTWFFQGLAKNNSITPISIVDSSNRHIQKMNAEAKIISKDDFADYVINHPQEFCFENFKKIYDVICEIIHDYDSTQAEIN